MAIQVGGTTVISNNRELSSVNGLKTVGGTSILGSGDIAVGGGGFPWNDSANIGNGTFASLINNGNTNAAFVSGGNNNGRHVIGLVYGGVTTNWNFNMNAGNGGGEGFWVITSAKYASNVSSGEFNVGYNSTLTAYNTFGTVNQDTEGAFFGSLGNNTRFAHMTIFGYVPPGGNITGARKSGYFHYWDV